MYNIYTYNYKYFNYMHTYANIYKIDIYYLKYIYMYNIKIRV